MRLYLIRHGESENNLAKKWTGWLDVSLTDKGVEDAKKAGALIDGIVFDKIYSSDLKRAVNTAQIAIPGCKPETTPLLREINIGSLAGTDFCIVSDEQRRNFSQNGYVDFGGESTAEFHSRISEFLKMAENSGCNNIAAFSHAGLLRATLDIVVGTYLPRDRIRCENCNIAVFEYNGNVWQLYSWINL